MSYASASIYAEPVSKTAAGFTYYIRCAISWGYGGGIAATAITYMKIEAGAWEQIHSQSLAFEDYKEWAFSYTFPLNMAGKQAYIQMGVPGVIGSNASLISIGSGFPEEPSPVIPPEPTPEPVIPIPPIYTPPYIPPTPECSVDSDCVASHGPNWVCLHGICVYRPEIITPPFVPSCVMTAIGVPLTLLGFLRTQVRPRMPAWFVRVYYRVNYHILSIFF